MVGTVKEFAGWWDPLDPRALLAASPRHRPRVVHVSAEVARWPIGQWLWLSHLVHGLFCHALGELGPP